jgi:hypothetical protein
MQLCGRGGPHRLDTHFDQGGLPGEWVVTVEHRALVVEFEDLQGDGTELVVICLELVSHGGSHRQLLSCDLDDGTGIPRPESFFRELHSSLLPSS